MKASVRIIAAAGFVAALGVAPLISIAQETPAKDSAAASSSSSESSSSTSSASSDSSSSASSSSSQ